ncbi:MAG: long-chain-fatty-acid--CoA ligase [Campylobacteraceae bacterium]|jgi:long-chain acyl-CoA synthetase|nr:long-chain-fatty-acid--CoA ligase [Campylobacteraceae bacterium]
MLNYSYKNFYEMISHNAKEYPKQIVLFCDKQKTSNLALKQKIDRLASFLYKLGIKKGDTVGLIIGNGEEFIVSLLAVTKIGAISVPINTFLKHEEFEHILNDCDAKLLFSSVSYEKETKRLLVSTKIEAIIWTDAYGYLDNKNIDYHSIINAKDELCDKKIDVDIDDLACIIYTSGTTGKPKGAMLSYRNMLSNMVAAKIAFEFTKKDRFIVYLPMFHSFTLTIMVLLPIYFSCSIVLIRSVFPFSNILKQTLLKGVTIFLGVPTIYNALLKAKIPWYFMWFHKIRLFISGSAPLSEKSLIDFSKKFKRGKLLEGYGLSECSPAVAVNRLEKQKPLSVGIALPSYEIKIVDDEMVELPTGEVGEIIVKGDCAMQGYLNRPEATAETLINGWVRTGDLGKLDEEGFLFIVDRKKDLIISKGINIYPREIEEVLYMLDDIGTTAVIGIKNDIGDEDVIAFIEYKDDAKNPLDEIGVKRYLKKHLANFKIPKHIYFSKELPKNATGKVLKRVLKEQVAKMDIKHIGDDEIL